MLTGERDSGQWPKTFRELTTTPAPGLVSGIGAGKNYNEEQCFDSDSDDDELLVPETYREPEYNLKTG